MNCVIGCYTPENILTIILRTDNVKDTTAYRRNERGKIT